MSDNGFFEKVGTAPRHRTNQTAIAMAGMAPVAIDPMSPFARPGSDTGHRSWSANDNVFWASKQTYDALPCGLYRCAFSHNLGPYLDLMRNETDTLVMLPDSASETILREIETFRGLKSKFSDRGFLHKRGVLMWGPPGSGKTSTLQLLIKLIVEQYSGIAVFVDHPDIAAKCLQMIRNVEPERPVIALMEDLDALVERHGEAEYLAMLDGESQVDNIVFVATTNYPERLDRRFVDRPSRFDTIRYIGMPSPAARACYLRAKETSYTDAEVDRLVGLSEGFSIAHLRELIILNRCFEYSIEDATARIKQFLGNKPASDKAPDRPAFGFNT